MTNSCTARLDPSRRSGFFAFALAMALASSGVVRADEPVLLTLALGAFNLRGDEQTAEGRIEYRSDLRFAIFSPYAGLMLNGEGGGMIYGGGKDLGSVFQIRSEIELAYRFDDDSRLGISFSHISNADTADKNTGAESLMLVYSLPLERLFGRD